MKTAKSVSIVLTLLVAFGTAASLTVTVFAGGPKPSYSLSIPSQTVNQPPTSQTETADFPITIVPGAGGYTDPVVLSVKDLPPGVSAAAVSWDDTPVVQANTTTPGDIRHLYLQVPSSVKVGTYQLTVHSVNANTGKDAQDTKATLGVAAPVSVASSFGLGVAPSSEVIRQGGTATYSVSLHLPSGYNGGAATLSVGGLPGGVKGTFSPASLSAAGQTSALTIPTTSKTKPGSYIVKITGSSAKTHVDVLVALTIQAVGGSTGFSLAVSPTQQQVAAGGTTSYAVGIARSSDFIDPVALTVSGLPVAATATWDADPPSYYGNAATLTITTDEVYTPDGIFNLAITGTSGSRTQTVTAKLVVNTPNGKAVGISGDVTTPLFMNGPSQPIDLTLSNPNDKPIWISNVTVNVVDTTNSGCTSADFVWTQYAGGYPLTVAKRASTNLSGLGVPKAQWPTVQLRNLATNQDACQHVTVHLAYSATAREAR